MTINTTGWTAGEPNLKSDCQSAEACLREALAFIKRARSVPLSSSVALSLDDAGACARMAHRLCCDLVSHLQKTEARRVIPG